MRHIHIILLLCVVLLTFPQLVQASKTYVVRRSESLNTIARKYHVSVDELKSVNSLNTTHVDRGARLIIPSHADAKARKAKETPATYKVAKGETLPAISKKTGVKLSDLRKYNSLKANKIKPGQVLALNDGSSRGTETFARTFTASNRLELVNRNLLNEQEFTNTLAELTDIDTDRPVDLAKNLENNGPSVARIKKIAYSFLGARYRFGGNSRYALDCSSFTQQVFREHKINIPRTAREQFYVGLEVQHGDLQKGDLVFFQTYARFPSHVGIYLGDRKMIHASSKDRQVVISSMDTPYYLARYLGARRIGKTSQDSINFDDLLLGVEEEKDADAQNNDMLGISLNVN